MFEQHLKSDDTPDLLWVKALLYRIIRMLIVFWSSWVVLGNTSTALSIMSIDVIIATLFYWGFDKCWPWTHQRINHLLILWKYRKLK